MRIVPAIFLTLLLTAAGCSGDTLLPPNPAGIRFVDPPTTFYGRSIAFNVKVDTPPDGDVFAVMDPGTPSEQTLTNAEACPFNFPLFWCGTDLNGKRSTTWPMYWPNTLANGPHLLRIVASNSDGTKSIVERRFVTDVEDIAYTATLLLNTSGGTGDALDINASGSAVGWVTDANQLQRAILWPTPTTSTFLDAVPSKAIAINDAGVTVGTFGAAAIMWSNNSRQTMLDSAIPVDVNRDGLVALQRASNSLNATPFLWQNGVLTTLPPCKPFQLCVFKKINDAGSGVGLGLSDHASEQRAVGYKLTLHPPVAPTTTAFVAEETVDALNNDGHYGGLARGGYRYALYRDSALLGGEFGLSSPQRDETAPPPGMSLNNPVVRGMNNAGDLLVFETFSKSIFILRGGRVLHVATNGDVTAFDDVHAINDAGWIVGRANSRPYLLRPVTQ